MSGFLHYLAVTPMRDYPWWGLVLLFAVPLGGIAALFDPTWWRTRPLPDIPPARPAPRSSTGALEAPPDFDD